METTKLHLRVGQHEFDAEGPEDVVKEAFEKWRALVEKATEGPPMPAADTQAPQVEMEARASDLSRIFKEDERSVSVKFLPQTEQRDADVVLLILYGQKILKQQDEVPVTVLKAALKQSGCPIDRVDRIVARYVSDGLLRKGGMGKGGVYQLSNVGEQRATRLIADLTE
jgi:hypothetical protein